jgi:hypothetical protein
VEPVKPIVYYLDPATPARGARTCARGWRTGTAFEKAGFRERRAGHGPAEPAEDPDWDPEDIRYSVVRWAASTTRNAQGPSTSDPRSGEIIESDIVWYHNHMRSYRNRLMIETGAANPVRALAADPRAAHGRDDAPGDHPRDRPRAGAAAQHDRQRVVSRGLAAQPSFTGATG